MSRVFGLFLFPSPKSSGPLASALSNRFGFRAVIVSGSVLGFAGLTCSSFAPSVDVLFLTVGLMCGVAFGLVWTPAVVAVSYFENRRSLATGVVMCGSGMGTFVFAPFIYWLLENYALRGTFLILVLNLHPSCFESAAVFYVRSCLIQRNCLVDTGGFVFELRGSWGLLQADEKRWKKITRNCNQVKREETAMQYSPPVAGEHGCFNVGT